VFPNVSGGYPLDPTKFLCVSYAEMNQFAILYFFRTRWCRRDLEVSSGIPVSVSPINSVVEFASNITSCIVHKVSFNVSG